MSHKWEFFSGLGSGELDYLLFTPNDSDQCSPNCESRIREKCSPSEILLRPPAIVYLHGAGGVKKPDNIRGQSLPKLLVDSAADSRDDHVTEGSFSTDFTKSCFNLHHYTVLAPVCPIALRKGGWPKAFPELMRLLARLIFEQNELGVDKGRVFLFGQSMGGNAALELAMACHGNRLPEGTVAWDESSSTGKNCSFQWRGMVCICGYVTESTHVAKSAEKENPQTLNNQGQVSAETKTRLERLMNTPMWFFHSADDAMVDVAHSDNLVAALSDLQGFMPADPNHSGAEFPPKLKYTRYETAPGLPGMGARGRGHASWELAFRDPELWKWIEKLAARIDEVTDG